MACVILLLAHHEGHFWPCGAKLKLSDIDAAKMPDVPLMTSTQNVGL